MLAVRYQNGTIFAIAAGVKRPIESTAQIAVIAVISILGEEQFVAAAASKALIGVASQAVGEPEAAWPAKAVTLVTSD